MGNIGLGSTQPTATLDVNGTVNVSGVSTFQDNVDLGDDDRLRFGANQDLEIFSTGTNSVIKESGSGNLKILGTNIIFKNAGETRVYADFNNGGSVDLYYDDSKKFETTGYGVTITGGINVSGISTFQNKVYHENSVYFADGSAGLNFGDDNDLTLYHTGNSSNIREDGTGNLNIWGNNISFIDSTGTRFYADFNDGDSVDLYYNGSKKFSTTGIGVSIVGTGNTATITGPENLVIDPAVVGDATGKVIILGDLQVDGTQTVINSTTLTVDDKSIVLASGAADSSAANGAGIEIDGASATFQYAHTGTKWVANKDLQAEAFIKNGGTSSQFLKADGSVDSSAYITSADGSDAATLGGINSTSFLRSDIADIKTSGNLKFNDGVQLRFGTDNDLQLYHSGTASMIVNTGTGNLRIRNTPN